MRFALAPMLAVAAVAPAQAGEETADGQLRAQLAGIHPDEVDPQYRWMLTRVRAHPGDLYLPRWASAHLYAGSAAGWQRDGGRPTLDALATAGGELALHSRACPVVAAGGAVTGRQGDGDWRWSGEQWTRICLFRGPSNWSLAHVLDWDVQPALSAPLNLRPGRNRRSTVRAQIDLLSIPVDLRRWQVRIDSPLFFEVFVVDSSMSMLLAGGEPDIVGALDFAMVRLERRWSQGPVAESSVEVLAIANDSSDQAFLTSIYLARAAGIPLGPLYLGGALGIGTGHAGEFVSQYDREVQSGNPVLLRGEVAGGGAGAWLELAGGRDLRAVFGGRIVIEDRLDASATLRRGPASARLTGFFASTRVLAAAPMPVAAELTGGAGVELAWSASPALQLTLAAEAARSYYAEAASDRPALGARVWAGLATRIDVR